MKTRYALLPIIAAPALVLLACRGETLDVGTTSTPDAATSDAPSLPADGGSELPLGLTIDGISCPAVVAVSGSADRWPAWSIHFSGPCVPFGAVSGTVSSRADIEYPQTCSVATSIAFSIPPDSDAGYVDMTADAVRGSCTLTTGPSTSMPSGLLTFEATLVRQSDAARSRHVTYRAAAPAATSDADAGDAGLPPKDADVPDAPGTACDLQPTGPSRSSATTCTPGTASDACQKDSDCAAGPCGCGVATDKHNVCLSNSDCRVDADCASGQRCVMSHPFILGYPVDLGGTPVTSGNEIVPPNNSFEEALGYFCTTPQDTCCPADAGASHTCVYDWGHKRWSAGYAL